jgi:hypothetical protein
MMISAASTDNNPKLSKVFDCILNTLEYFRYVKALYWVYDNAVNTIVRVDVRLDKKDVPTNQQRVWLYNKGTRASNPNKDVTYNKIKVEDLNDDAKKSFSKRYKADGENNFKLLVQGISDPEKFGEIAISDCASVWTNSNTVSNNGPFNTKSWELNTFVNNLHYWQRNICEEQGKKRQSYGGCGTCTGVINRALRDTLGGSKKYWGNYPWDVCRNLKVNDSEFKEAVSGVTTNKQEFNFGSIKPSRGDICTMWSLPQSSKKGSHFHTCAFDGTHWVSDFVQDTCNVYRSKSACQMEFHLFKHK